VSSWASVAPYQRHEPGRGKASDVVRLGRRTHGPRRDLDRPQSQNSPRSCRERNTVSRCGGLLSLYPEHCAALASLSLQITTGGKPYQTSHTGPILCCLLQHGNCTVGAPQLSGRRLQIGGRRREGVAGAMVYTFSPLAGLMICAFSKKIATWRWGGQRMVNRQTEPRPQETPSNSQPMTLEAVNGACDTYLLP
jgi:hypothetical protein